MASPLLLPGRRRTALSRVVDLHRVSKPQLSLLILVATALTMAVVLLIWLLLWMTRTRIGIEGWWIAQRGLASPVVGYQANDLGRILSSPTRASADVTDRTLEQALRSRLARSGRRPVVVYLSAVGIADDQGAFLLRPEPGSLQVFAPSGARQWLVTPERLIDLFAESPSPKKLLILDAAQLGSDRNLGVYANGFLHRLKVHLETKPVRGLAILSSCAPGQTSWTVETDKNSVFGHYVALGLTGAATGWDPSTHGLTVRALGRYVRQHVSRWVAANRQAEQTPVLLGDSSVNFLLPHTTTPRIGAVRSDPKDTERLWLRLDEAWARRDALDAKTPYRHTPLQWRRYQETLLRAERLARHGESVEAEELLGQLPTLEKSIAGASGGLPFEKPWSLALLNGTISPSAPASDARRTEVSSVSDRLDVALKDLTAEDEEDTQPIEVEPGSVPEVAVVPPKPDPAAKADEVALATPLLSARRKPAKAASKDRKPGTQGGPALSTLVDRGDRGRPLYVEAQLLVWADTFAKRSRAPFAFKGQRGELLDEAMGVRRIAEEAAAADERIGRWVAPLVDAGDELRRRAQDGLFAGGTGSGTNEALRRLLDDARTLDRQALEAADRCARALRLVEQIEAELPYYGEWKARQTGHRDEGLDTDMIALLASSTRLARLLQADSRELGSRRSTAEARDDAPQAVLDRIKEVEETYREVKDHWDRLVTEFQAQSTSLAGAGGAGRWREIDRILCVPMIPAEIRRALVRRVQSVAVAFRLSGHEEVSPVPTTSGSEPSDFQGYARQQTEKAIAGAAREVRDDDRGNADAPGPASADPDFWNLALALARLDWGLLELGGASDSDLSRIDSAFPSARNAARGDPAVAFEAFERLSRVLRAARSDRLQAIQQTRSTTYVPLAVADRAARVLPMAETLGTSDKATESLDRFQRQALLLWHGRRLLRDFAPEHAMRLLEEARQFFDTEDLRAAVDEAVAMTSAKIGVALKSEENLVISEWVERALDVEVATSGTLPAGDAVVLIEYDTSQPLSVSSKATHQGARDGVLVPVATGKQTRTVAYVVQRTESTPEPLTVPVTPGVFFRGRFFPADRKFDVTIDPAHDPVAVTVQQSYEGLPFRDFTDQFKEHPGQGYLHYGTNLKYKLVFTTERPMKLWVRYGLKEHPESFKTKMVEVGASKKADIIDLIHGNDFPIVKSSELLEIAPLTLQVTVHKDRENGEIVGKGRYAFRMIPPPQYISVAANFDPGTRLLYLDVVHLANDPVTGPVKVVASVGGQDGWAWIRRSRFVTFAIQIPPTMKKITWRVGVESMPNAFHEEIETPIPQVEQPPMPPAL